MPYIAQEKSERNTVKRATIASLFGAIFVALTLAVVWEHRIVRQQTVVSQELQRKLTETKKQLTEVRRWQNPPPSFPVGAPIAPAPGRTFAFPQNDESLTLYPNTFGVPASDAPMPIPNARPGMARVFPIPPAMPGLASATPIPLAPFPQSTFDPENPSFDGPNFGGAPGIRQFEVQIPPLK